ncbi:MAG: NifU family protein [Coprobacillus sp.]|nr:NifU family protein [Coprobacillus sp.]
MEQEEAKTESCRSENEIITDIKKCIEKLRFFLQREGGDIEFISYEEGIVYVILTGACQDCFLAMDDITGVVTDVVTDEVSEVTEVRMADYDRIKAAKGLTEEYF